jgi:phage shock protein E
MTIEFELIKPYLLPVAVAAYLLFRHFRFKIAMKKLPGLAAAGAVFVDVRTPAEFASGNKPGSINIPLDAIARQAEKLDKAKPLILSCASGARSGAAATMLKGMGFLHVTNAGPWQNTL